MRGEENPVYAAEREERACALRSMTESERAASCEHRAGISRHGCCITCGERVWP